MFSRHFTVGLCDAQNYYSKEEVFSFQIHVMQVRVKRIINDFNIIKSRLVSHLILQVFARLVKLMEVISCSKFLRHLTGGWCDTQKYYYKDKVFSFQIYVLQARINRIK